MCLALPGKIIEINADPDSLLRMAVVDFNGVRRNICIDTVDNAQVGSYVIAHAGVAISVMDVDEALATIADLETLANNTQQE